MNAGTEALLDEVEDLKPVAEISIDPLRGKFMCGQKGLPTGIRCAVLVDARGEFLANLCRCGRSLLPVRGLGCLQIFAANLLFNERLADQLIERALAGESALPGAAGSSTDRRISSSISLARMA